MQDRPGELNQAYGQSKHDCNSEQIVFVQRMRQFAEKIEHLEGQFSTLSATVTKHRTDFIKAYRSQFQQGKNIQLQQTATQQALEALNITVLTILGDVQLIKPDVDNLRHVKTKFDIVKKWANRAAWIIAAVAVICFFSQVSPQDSIKFIIKAVV